MGKVHFATYEWALVGPVYPSDKWRNERKAEIPCGIIAAECDEWFLITQVTADPAKVTCRHPACVKAAREAKEK